VGDAVLFLKAVFDEDLGMRTIKHPAEELSPVLSLELNTRRLTDLIAVGSVLAVFLIACSTYPVYSGMLSAIVFAAVSLLVPEWRINQRILLSPANWAILAFGSSW
jgi:hypothetical protein